MHVFTEYRREAEACISVSPEVSTWLLNPTIYLIVKTINVCVRVLPCIPQGAEYGTDEEEDEDEEVSPSYPSAIEVFDLAENEDMSPLETDPEKLAHKYKEVRRFLSNWNIF